MAAGLSPIVWSAPLRLYLNNDWANEFYRLPNDFGHGKMQTRQPRTWNSACHLLPGAIAFPLLVKNLWSATESIASPKAIVARFWRSRVLPLISGIPLRS